jgi:hypothetical protein
MGTVGPREPAPAASPHARRRAVVLGLAAALVLGAALAVAPWQWWHRPDVGPPADGPGAAFASPYRNAAAGVRYVGDRACAECHTMEHETFQHHPMGRAFAAVAATADQERLGKRSNNPFDRLGFRFAVERRGGRVYHKTIRLGKRGQVVTEREDEVAFVLGSRTRGCSYLIDHDGYLFQSPISWFTQKQVWDLSPGFDATLLGGRPVSAECLYCHSNHARPVRDTLNRFDQPTFDRGYAIGCERCHGPGELHVEKQWRQPTGAGPDDTIVNPARLSPRLREAVCQQCHLVAEARVLRRGRSVDDYRPGLPLDDYWSIFTLPQRLSDNYRAVGQVEQMYASKCFRTSGGKLGCVSCHDAHGLPGPAQRTTFYRSRCLQCHQDTDCRLPKHDRLARSMRDSCIDCHMPRFQSNNIAHTALTDHRILRRPKPAGLGPGERVLLPAEAPIVRFPPNAPVVQNADADRDLGLGLMDFARKYPALNRQAAERALPLLNAAAEAHPDDVAAWEAKGQALRIELRWPEALAAFEMALDKAPEREASLQAAAELADDLGRKDDAIAYWQRVLAVDPWNPGGLFRLAVLLADRHDWQEAVAACVASLRLHPASVEARMLLVRCHLQTGNRDEARKEFATVLALRPGDEPALRRWFAEQTR